MSASTNSNKCVCSGSSHGFSNNRSGSSTSSRCTHCESRRPSPPPDHPAGEDGNKGASFSHFQYSNTVTSRRPVSEEDPLAKEIDAEYNQSAKLQHRLKH
ncbi:hypothetical protein FHETE_10623 [Fusarium heterosporum]|uniref:Uncharacterized protein n=1 Tax=Fusarium heterosporum TaxID=42747 RepID=A0A8H5WC76_FUSHE|nr:hypothetical protein FHETE_10623 [Fusarium heterosporum]